MDEAAAGCLIGFAADDEGDEAVGVALEEVGEFLAADGAGATGHALGDLKAAQQLHFAGHGHIPSNLLGVMSGGG